MTKNKILFLLKRREDYSSELHSYSFSLSTGLWNSVFYISQMLNENGIESEIKVIVDGNSVDREVTRFKPTVCFLEALYVPVEKYEILQRLHPTVKFITRLHSEINFIAGEGQAMRDINLLLGYKNVSIACNAPRMLEEVKFIARHNYGKDYEDKVVYLPNYYPQEYQTKQYNPKEIIHIGNYGAVRLLKANLIQGISALKFAEKIGKKLYFHINDRIEMNGNPVSKNLVQLFEELSHKGHKLIIDKWQDKASFLETCKTMDLGMQVSLSETFCFVASDFCAGAGIPIITSSEIPWSSKFSQANPTSSKSILNALVRAHTFPQLNVYLNQRKLTQYTNKTRKIWLDFTQ